MRIALVFVALVLVALVVVDKACAATIKPDPAAVAAAAVPFPYAQWDRAARAGTSTTRAASTTRDRLARPSTKVFAAVAASSPKQNPDQYPTADARRRTTSTPTTCWCGRTCWPPAQAQERRLARRCRSSTSPSSSSVATEMNLYDLENKIVRPQFKDARVHFALNCASGGCPSCRRGVHAGQGRRAAVAPGEEFCNEPRNVDFDPATKKLELSHIFDWYKDDFGKEPAKVIAWINQYRAADASYRRTRRSSTSTTTGRSTTEGDLLNR